jgi:uncharacterized membrane protein
VSGGDTSEGEEEGETSVVLSEGPSGSDSEEEEAKGRAVKGYAQALPEDLPSDASGAHPFYSIPFAHVSLVDVFVYDG